MVTFINEASLAFFNGASPSTMERLCCGKYTKEHVGIMQAVEHLWLKPSELGFIGQQQQLMQET
jgi:hypothetical protein